MCVLYRRSHNLIHFNFRMNADFWWVEVAYFWRVLYYVTWCKVRYKQNVQHILDAGKSILISYSIPILHISISSCLNINVPYMVLFFCFGEKIEREKKTKRVFTFSKSYKKLFAFSLYIYCERVVQKYMNELCIIKLKIQP